MSLIGLIFIFGRIKDLFWHERRCSVIVFVDLYFVFRK